MPTFEYDVAISFRHPDLQTALLIRDALSPALKVFVYTHNQDVVAGTDGTETFRKVFRTDARLVVILFRDGWGQTKWTRIEDAAIHDRFLDEGMAFLKVVTVRRDDVVPNWIPDRLIRQNLEDYSPEEVAGVIKARAQEAGATLKVDTIAARAARSLALAEFNDETTTLSRSEQGVAAVKGRVREILATTNTLVEGINASSPNLLMEIGVADPGVGVRIGRVGATAGWRNMYSNSLDASPLIVTSYKNKIILPGETGSFYRREPEVVEQFEFTPTRRQDLGWCWMAKDGRCRTSAQLAELTVTMCLDLYDKAAAGKLPVSYD